MSPYRQNYFGFQGKQESRKFYLEMQISLTLKNPSKSRKDCKEKIQIVHKNYFFLYLELNTFGAQRGTFGLVV